MNSVSLRNPRPRQLRLKQQPAVIDQVNNSKNPKSEKGNEPSQPQCGGGVCEIAWRPNVTRSAINTNAS
jgi:hypothetical protein